MLKTGGAIAPPCPPRNPPLTNLRYNPESQQVKPFTNVTYLAEQTEEQTSIRRSIYVFTQIAIQKIPTLSLQLQNLEIQYIFKPDKI